MGASVNFHEHASEAGVTVAGGDLIRAAAQLPSFGPISSWWMKIMPPRLENASFLHAVPIALTPERIAEGKRAIEGNPKNLHLHLWSVDSMRNMMKAAIPLFASQGVHFDIVDVHSASATWINMQEIRLTLRRIKK